MATTKVQSATRTNGSGTVTFIFGAAPTAGNLLVAWVTCLATAVSNTITATNGFTALTVANNGVPKGYIFWKVATAGDAGSSSVAVATFAASNAGQGIADEWSTTNGWPANPVDTENTQSFASTNSPTTPTVTPTSGLTNALVATGYANTGGRSFSAEAVSGSNVGTVTEDGETNSTALATAVISSTTGSYQGSATLGGPGAAGFDAIAIFKPTATATTAYKDTTTRVRINVRKYKDVTIRFATRAAMAKDATLRLVLRATTWKDVTARVRLYILRYRDVTARVGIALALGQAYKDVTARVRLAASNWRDCTIRYVSAFRGYADVSLRFRTENRGYRNVTMRFRMVSADSSGQVIVTSETAYNASDDQGLSEVAVSVVSRTEYGPR
jgi:hypothetical protein